MKTYIYTSKDIHAHADLDKDVSKAVMLCKGYLEVLDMVRQTRGVWYRKGRGTEKIKFTYVLPPSLLLLITAQLAFFLLPLSRKVILPFLIFLSEGLGLVTPKPQCQKL